MTEVDFDEGVDGPEAGPAFYYCSERCREAHYGDRANQDG